MAGVLFFDTSTKLNGYCAGDGVGAPVADAWEFPDFGDDLGALACAMEDQVMTLVDRHQPDLIGYESPILVRFDALLKIRKLYGLGFEVERVAKRLQIPCFEVDLRKVKAELTGKHDATKTEMVRAAMKLGIELPKTIALGREDAADAVGGWKYGLRSLSPRVADEWDHKLYSSRGALL